MRTALTSALVALALGLPFAGCGHESDRVITQNSGGTNGGGNGGNGAADGVVGDLTGDDDSEVDDATEQLVFDALQRGDTDEPLDF